MTDAAPGRRRALPLAAVGILIAIGLAVGILRPQFATEMAQGFLNTARGAGPIGWAAFVVLQLAVAATGILPASLLGIAAGALYGVPLGFALASLSTLAGALVAFGLSRYLFRSLIARLLAKRPRLENFDALLVNDGWRVVCLLRLSPIMPFAATSYALGMSAIGLPAYCVGTLASMPALLGYVILGKFSDVGISSFNTGLSGMHWALLLLGIAATVGLTFVVGQMARRAAASK